MVSKEAFTSKCGSALSNYFTEVGTKSTIDVMANLKLIDYEDSDEVPQEMVEACTKTLFERVRMLKGDDKAKSFLNELKA